MPGPAASSPPSLYRVDLFAHRLNRGKEAGLRALLAAWRRGAVPQAAQQRGMFFRDGRVNKRAPHARAGFEHLPGALAQQMRWAVVDVIEGWLGQRVADVRALIGGSTLDPVTRHQLYVINKAQAWFLPGEFVVRARRGEEPGPADGTTVPPDIRRLARRLFHQAAKRHRWPDVRHIGMRLDVRGARVETATTSAHFPVWLSLATLKRGQRLTVPLLANRHAAERLVQPGARRVQGVQVIERRAVDGRGRVTSRLEFGLLTDVGAVYAASRAAYVPRTDVVALDLGLTTLFGASTGQLLGQRWRERLEAYDRKLTRLARHRQQMRGRRAHRPGGPRLRSPRYAALVERLRGFVTSEVNRLLNRVVAQHAPAVLRLEALDFRGPGLSRRLNRLLRWVGQ